jgi:Uma2 family endonuclease
VSKGRRNRTRDFEIKRDEYLAIDVKEYWVIDRFDRCMVVFTKLGDETKYRVIRENQIYKTRLLPGFELPLAQLLALADEWASDEEEPETNL